MYRMFYSILTTVFGSCRSAVAQACNIAVWDDQVALFDLAVKTYGGVDIAVSLRSLLSSVSFTK